MKERIAVIQGRINQAASVVKGIGAPPAQLEKDFQWLVEQVTTLQIERNAALKLLGYDEAENDLLANIKRLKAHYEQELAYLREGEQALMRYCEKLQERVDPKDAIAIGLKELLNLQISRQQDEKTTKPERNP